MNNLKTLLRKHLLMEQNNNPNIELEKEKFYKASKMKIWFLENVVDKVKQITKPEYPNYIFYVDKNTNETYMEYNQKNGILWVSYYKIWSYFESNYSHNNIEIRQLIKDLVGEHYNLWDITPKALEQDFITRRVGEHYNFLK